MLSDRMKALIRDYNPWWEGTPISVPEYKRHIYSDVQKYMRTKQIIAIAGLRRVGKTIKKEQKGPYRPSFNYNNNNEIFKRHTWH